MPVPGLVVTNSGSGGTTCSSGTQARIPAARVVIGLLFECNTIVRLCYFKELKPLETCGIYPHS